MFIHLWILLHKKVRKYYLLLYLIISVRFGSVFHFSLSKTFFRKRKIQFYILLFGGGGGGGGGAEQVADSDTSFHCPLHSDIYKKRWPTFEFNSIPGC